MPVSVTEISIARLGIAAAPDGSCSSRLSAQLTPSVTLPFEVNLNAFDSRLRTICCSRFSSVRMVSRQLAVELDVEVEALVGGELAEGPLHVLLEMRHRHVADLDRHRAGFDLRQVEDVVDQVEQVGARRVDRPGELDLLLVEIALRVVGQQLGQDEQRVERRSQLVAHVGQELGLVLGGERELLGFLLERAAGHFDLEVLGFDLLLLVLEQLRLFLQLLVGRVQLLLLAW